LCHCLQSDFRSYIPINGASNIGRIKFKYTIQIYDFTSTHVGFLGMGTKVGCHEHFPAIETDNESTTYIRQFFLVSFEIILLWSIEPFVKCYFQEINIEEKFQIWLFFFICLFRISRDKSKLVSNLNVNFNNFYSQSYFEYFVKFIQHSIIMKSCIWNVWIQIIWYWHLQPLISAL